MLSGYDQWKLAYPPWWDDPPICEGCDKEVEEYIELSDNILGED